jgi:TolB protein
VPTIICPNSGDSIVSNLTRRTGTIGKMGFTCALAAVVTCASAEDKWIRGPIPNLWTRPAGLVVPDFAAADPRMRQSAAHMVRFIAGVLQRSCRFKLVDSDDVGGKAPGIDDALPDFSYWRSTKVDVVVAGRLMELADGRLQVEVRMWDVWSPFPAGQFYGQRFMAPPDKMQRLSYVVAGDMYERLCGDHEWVRHD